MSKMEEWVLVWQWAEFFSWQQKRKKAGKASLRRTREGAPVPSTNNNNLAKYAGTNKRKY